MNIIVQWLSDLLKALFDFTSLIGIPSYGIAIILLTIIIKMILYPLTWKQLSTMRRTQKLMPKVQEIQKKYKNDPQKANTMIMELYKENNANPLSGCLPLLIQMPIFIALYRALGNFQYGDPTFLYLNLTQKDPYFILAILAALTTFLQSKVSMPKTGAADPTQKTMLYIMPLFMAYISYSVPSGLALYWVVMNVMTVLQQLFTNYWLDRKEKQATQA